MGVEISLVHKVAIITGAGRGIGAKIAERMAEAGAELYLVDINEDGLRNVQESLKSYGKKVVIKACDLSDAEVIPFLIADVKAQMGRIDILVNNAAVNYRETAFDVDIDHWQKIMNLNLRGTFLMAREVAGKMIEDGNKGVVINIGSELSFVGLPEGQVAYSTSKAGINQLGRVLAAEWAKYNIRVVTVIPSLTETALVAENLKKPGYREKFEKDIPLGRIAKPEDIANAVLFMASEMADFITGETLLVDGGYTNTRP